MGEREWKFARLATLADLRDDAESAVRAEIARLVRAGESYGEIAKVLGVVSRQAVRQYHLRHQEPLEAARAVLAGDQQ